MNKLLSPQQPPEEDPGKPLEDHQAQAAGGSSLADFQEARRLMHESAAPGPMPADPETLRLFEEFMATRQAQQTAAPKPAPAPEPEAETADERIAVTVMLKPFHHAYLLRRAADHGETPERHLETILRNFRSYYDDRRPDHHRPAPDRGQPASTFRA